MKISVFFFSFSKIYSWYFLPSTEWPWIKFYNDLFSCLGRGACSWCGHESRKRNCGQVSSCFQLLDFICWLLAQHKDAVNTFGPHAHKKPMEEYRQLEICQLPSSITWTNRICRVRLPIDQKSIAQIEWRSNINRKKKISIELSTKNE